CILLLSPLLLTIGCAIIFGSKGPLFFQTEVIGQGGKIFRWYKFRTMRMGIKDEIHREHVSEHIRIGSRPNGKLECAHGRYVAGRSTPLPALLIRTIRLLAQGTIYGAALHYRPLAG